MSKEEPSDMVIEGSEKDEEVDIRSSPPKAQQPTVRPTTETPASISATSLVKAETTTSFLSPVATTGTDDVSHKLEEAREMLNHLREVLLSLDQAARGKAINASSLSISPQNLLEKAKVWTKRYHDVTNSHVDSSNPEQLDQQPPASEELRVLYKQIVDKAETITTR